MDGVQSAIVPYQNAEETQPAPPKKKRREPRMTKELKKLNDGLLSEYYRFDYNLECIKLMVCHPRFPINKRGSQYNQNTLLGQAAHHGRPDIANFLLNTAYPNLDAYAFGIVLGRHGISRKPILPNRPVRRVEEAIKSNIFDSLSDDVLNVIFDFLTRDLLDLNKRSPELKESPLTIAVRSAFHARDQGIDPHLEVVKLLLSCDGSHCKSKLDLNRRDCRTMTVLDKALEKDTRFLKLLLDTDSHKFVEPFKPVVVRRALKYAIEEHTRVIENLSGSESSAAQYFNDKYFTPLERKTVVELLQRYQEEHCSPNTEDESGSDRLYPHVSYHA